MPIGMLASKWKVIAKVLDFGILERNGKHEKT
jgi:hypothetical protein